MKIKDLIDRNYKKECEILIANILQKDRIWVHLNLDLELGEENFLIIKNKIQQLQNNYPFEYILGLASFYSREFLVCEGVLIPRPETEILIDKTLEIIRKNDLTKIAEIGSGSGIIPITLALEEPKLHIISGDINEVATKLSLANKAKFSLQNVDFIYSDLFENMGQNIELLISNPPYIQDDFNLPENVKFEPSNALFGGVVGDEILKQIIDGCVMRNIRFLCCEMGYDQKHNISEYLKKYNPKTVEFYKDLAGFDRGFCVEFEI